VWARLQAAVLVEAAALLHPVARVAEPIFLRAPVRLAVKQAAQAVRPAQSAAQAVSRRHQHEVQLPAVNAVEAQLLERAALAADAVASNSTLQRKPRDPTFPVSNQRKYLSFLLVPNSIPESAVQ
jgi:hypothetical protein